MIPFWRTHMPNQREFNTRHNDVGITGWSLHVTWSDGLKENLGASLPEYLLNEIEAYFVEMDQHRSEVGDDYNFEPVQTEPAKDKQ